jgi:hypothetical protein
MKSKITKLIDVKSLVTLAFTVLVFILALNRVISAEQVMMTYTTIIAFYFGTQSQKKAGVDDGNKES